MTLEALDRNRAAESGQAGEVDAGAAFAERFIAALNDAAMIFMMSIGHQTGLFDALAEASPATSTELAEKAGLDERHVREWLSAMTTARVVAYDPASRRFTLPPAHAALLTRAASPNNLAVAAQHIPGIAAVEPAIVEAFRTGKGLHYHQYERFHEIMAEDSGQTVVAALFDHILPLVPGLAERLEAGIDVLDVGCGAGRAMVALAERFPASRFTGYDLTEEGIALARAEAAAKGTSNVTFETRDLAVAPPTGSYDLVTAFDAVHDQRDPAGLLGSIARVLRRDGVFLMQDIAGSSRLEENLDHPLGTFVYAVSTGHCMSVSLGQGGPGLGAMWGEDTAERMLREAGFSNVAKRLLPHDPFNVYFLARL